MEKVTAAFAALQLQAADPSEPKEQLQDAAVSSYATFSPVVSRKQLQPCQARTVCLFSDAHNSHSHVSDEGRVADWSAVTADVFQAVVHSLPAHCAQHAMLVCQHWHNSVTHGLLELRPRILNLHNIAVR